jgi:glycosyltransferase involved in cell wall biosynthesis
MLYGGLMARLFRIPATLGTLSAFACMVPDRDYPFLPQRLATQTSRNRLRNRIVISLMRCVAVASPDLGSRFCAYNRIPADRLRTVPYGVQLGEPPGSAARIERRLQVRAELGLADNDLVVASVGRLVEQKDYPTQLNGFAAAARQEPRLRMLLVGDGPLRVELEELALRLDVASRVTFLGYRSDVPRLLQAVDIFTLASRFEPFGVSILEAKANGTPILAAAVDEIPRLLAHGRAGRLFEAGSAASYSAELLAMTRNPLECAVAAQRAYAEAQENHGLTAMIEAYQRLYDELLEAVSR